MRVDPDTRLLQRRFRSPAAPLRKEVASARDRAVTALESAGATVRHERIDGLRSAQTTFLATALAEFDVVAAFAVVAESVVTDAHGKPVNFPLSTLLPDVVVGLAERAPVRLLRDLATRRVLSAARRAADDIAERLAGAVLVHPSFPRVAPRHYTTYGQTWLVAPQVAFNVFGMPTTQVPVGLDERGRPLGVQVAAAPGMDHRTIAVAMALENALGGWVPPAPR